MEAIKIWFWVSSIFLAAVLFKPVKKSIFVQRVRKAERKSKKDLTEEERAKINKNTTRVTVIIVTIFSILFNSIIMGKYFK